MTESKKNEKDMQTIFMPVEGIGDLKRAKKRGLAIRRKGSELEGVIVRVHDKKSRVIVQYPDHGDCKRGFKKGSTCIITRLEKYEIEPTFLMQKYLWELAQMMETGEFDIPRCQQDRPDIDVLGIFLANNGPEEYLRSRQSCEKSAESKRNKEKMLLVIKWIKEHILRFEGMA